MKLGDIYRHKQNNSIIQISNFANPMMRYVDKNNYIVVFNNILKDKELGFCSDFSGSGYGTPEEIEKEYELLVAQEELSNYNTWEEIFELVK